jgi:hypothetical protein
MRIEFRRRCKALIMIQAAIKGFITRRRYVRNKGVRRENAALKLQSRFRCFKERRKFLKMKKALMHCQANVLARQFRRAFVKMRSDVVVA